MIKLYIYSVPDGIFKYTDLGTENDVTRDIAKDQDFTLTAPPDYDCVWRWVDTEWVELLPINNPQVPYDDISIWNDIEGQWVTDDTLLAEKKVLEQAQVWDSIKSKRLSQVTNGVLVESVNKVFHTDSMSAIQYSTIAGMAAMGTYEPVNWKVMDNSWVLLTVELLKELQVAISVKTNTNYKVAEQHKAAMLLVDNPLDYDYSTNWI